MSGPGDRAPKNHHSWRADAVRTMRKATERGPTRVDVDPPLPPGSEEFGTLTTAFCTGAGRSRRGPRRSMVGGRQPREGDKPQAAAASVEKSDEAIVPKKSAKTRVTPVEPMEGRAEAKGKSAARNALLDSERDQSALTYLQRMGERAKRETRGEVDQSAEPHAGAAAEGGVPAPSRRCGRRRGWGDLGRVRRASRRAPARPGRPQFIVAAITRSRCGASTSRKGMGRRGRSASRRWKTRSSSRRRGWCWSRSTRRSSSGSRTGSGRSRSPHDALDALADGDRTGRSTGCSTQTSRSFFDTIDHRMDAEVHRAPDRGHSAWCVY